MNTITKTDSLHGEVTIPGDKSISHRAIMLGALSRGRTEIANFLQGADCLSTIDCFLRMGIPIENNRNIVTIHGKGLHGLSRPSSKLDAGNSGTTTRLISGILAGQQFESVLTGDASIQRRPMKRIIEPLSMMDAEIHSINGNGCAPLYIQGHPLHGIHYTSEVASAQVKSCILFAGMYAEDGPTSVTEPFRSRNHSELMMNHFGACVQTEGTTVTILPEPPLTGQRVVVPGDISSAAYFIAAGLIVPDAEIYIKNVGINPTRDGILKVCEAMGADITLMNVSFDSGEPTADLLVRSSSLDGVTIGGELIPTLIDEIPIIAVLACFADGKTVIKDAQELKVKESNRIDVVVEGLRAMGASIEATEDGMIIEGGNLLYGTEIDSHLDHRIAMAFTVAGLASGGTTTILDSDCVKISYPNFYEDLYRLMR